MVPGQGLSAEGRQITGVHALGGAPLPHLKLAVAPAQIGRLNRIGPGLIGAIRRFKPGIQPGPGAPGRLNHGREAPVPPPDKVLHRRETHIGEIRLQPAQLAQGLPQELLPANKFSRADAVPLEGGVGLGGEIADGEVELQPPQITALLLQGAAGLSNAQDVGIGLPRQANHEIELDLAIAALHGGTDPPQQLGVGQALVDDVPQALGAGLGRKGQARLAGPAQDVGDVLVEAVDPLTGQGQGDVLIGEAVAQLHPHRRQGQVVRAAQGQQGEIGIARALHACFDGLHHGLWFHVPGRTGEHPWLAEAAAAGAASANLHGEAVVNRLDMGHQTHGVVGHGRRGAAHHPLGDPGMQRLLAHPVGARPIEGGDIDPWHLGQIQQQRPATEARSLGLRDH